MNGIQNSWAEILAKKPVTEKNFEFDEIYRSQTDLRETIFVYLITWANQIPIKWLVQRENK